MELLLAGISVSGNDLVTFVITILIVGVVFWLLTWLVAYVGVAEPFSKVLKAVIAVVAVIFVIKALLDLTGVRLG